MTLKNPVFMRVCCLKNLSAGPAPGLFPSRFWQLPTGPTARLRRAFRPGSQLDRVRPPGWQPLHRLFVLRGLAWRVLRSGSVLVSTTGKSSSLLLGLFSCVWRASWVFPLALRRGPTLPSSSPGASWAALGVSGPSWSLLPSWRPGVALRPSWRPWSCCGRPAPLAPLRHAAIDRASSGPSAALVIGWAERASGCLASDSIKTRGRVFHFWRPVGRGRTSSAGAARTFFALIRVFPELFDQDLRRFVRVLLKTRTFDGISYPWGNGGARPGPPRPRKYSKKEKRLSSQ